MEWVGGCGIVEVWGVAEGSCGHLCWWWEGDPPTRNGIFLDVVVRWRCKHPTAGSKLETRLREGLCLIKVEEVQLNRPIWCKTQDVIVWWVAFVKQPFSCCCFFLCALFVRIWSLIWKHTLVASGCLYVHGDVVMLVRNN